MTYEVNMTNIFFNLDVRIMHFLDRFNLIIGFMVFGMISYGVDFLLTYLNGVL